MGKRLVATFGVTVDAVAGWIGTYGGGNSVNEIQRGIFAAEVGIPRLLGLFDKFDIATTWFVPGHSVESFPEQIRAVAEAGHEIAAHGYSHENPALMSRQQEADVLGRSVEVITEISGTAPRGYTAPFWESSTDTMNLLLEHGFLYDHSQGYGDFEVGYARTGDSWTNIDYERPAAEWMKPLVRGPEVDIVEISANWYVDDLPPMMFMKDSPNSHGFVSPRDIEESWIDQFDWVYENIEEPVFPITIHPDVSGRPQVLAMLDRLIRHISSRDGVEWQRMDQVAEEFRARKPFAERPEVK